MVAIVVMVVVAAAVVVVVVVVSILTMTVFSSMVVMVPMVVVVLKAADVVPDTLNFHFLCQGFVLGHQWHHIVETWNAKIKYWSKGVNTEIRPGREQK